VLVLNGTDPHSIMAMQILIKTLNVSMITCTTDSFENQKFLQDHFTNQQMNIVFTPTERDPWQKCMEITNGIGYDLILDFAGSMEHMKRQCLKLATFYGIIATSYKDMQLDPPESKFLNQKCVTMSFINYQTLLESGLHDGVARTLLSDIHVKLLKNEFGHVMSQFVNSN
jgi:threonine dehydrogenase-like Zn-dependent dehydrogenase